MPEEVEDIFAESEPAPREKPPEKEPAPVVEEEIEEEEAVRMPEEEPARGPFPWRVILIIAAALIILGGLGAAGYFLYQNFFSGQDGKNGDESGAAVDMTRVGAEEEARATVKITDTDYDGLSDEEEAELNTSIKSADTDGDGLTDREEVRVYLTDPLDPDSDKDGYEDGEEVENGFNPLGKGPLLDLEEEIKRINNSE